MKNFRLITLLMILTYSVSSAQTIGDHLNYIRQEKKDGFLKSDTDKRVHFYNWSDDKAIWVYVLDVDLVCIGIMINPRDAAGRNILAGMFESDPVWIKIDERNWKYYRNDGRILLCSLQYVDDVGPTFVITELQ